MADAQLEMTMTMTLIMKMMIRRIIVTIDELRAWQSRTALSA